MRKPKALFLIRGGHMLIPNSARHAFIDLLEGKAGLDLTVDEDYAELTPERLGGYDVILSCAGGSLMRYRGGRSVREANDAEVSALLDAIERGKPFIGLHCASLMFINQLYYRQPLSQAVRRAGPDDLLQMFQVRFLEMVGNAVLEWPDDPRPNNLLTDTQLRYIEMIGLNFVTDDGLEDTQVRIVDREHPITRGVDDFVIYDECYHMVGDRSKLHVLAEAKGWPLAWHHRWGDGKVHYNALGHDHSGVTHPSYQRMVVNAVDWALERSGAPTEARAVELVR